MLISNQPLREAFEGSSFTACDLARALELKRKRRGNDAWDDARVKRALGLKGRSDYAGGRGQKQIAETTALRYAKALGLDPVDLGL